MTFIWLWIYLFFFFFISSISFGHSLLLRLLLLLYVSCLINPSLIRTCLFLVLPLGASISAVRFHKQNCSLYPISPNFFLVLFPFFLLFPFPFVFLPNRCQRVGKDKVGDASFNAHSTLTHIYYVSVASIGGVALCLLV